jgi:hypothetical protein
MKDSRAPAAGLRMEQSNNANLIQYRTSVDGSLAFAE